MINTLFTFSVLPPRKFIEALFLLQTSFITLSPSSIMIENTKIISVLGILWKKKQKAKIFKNLGRKKLSLQDKEISYHFIKQLPFDGLRRMAEWSKALHDAYN